jgi:hypothetical protein
MEYTYKNYTINMKHGQQILKPTIHAYIHQPRKKNVDLSTLSPNDLINLAWIQCVEERLQIELQTDNIDIFDNLIKSNGMDIHLPYDADLRHFSFASTAIQSSIPSLFQLFCDVHYQLNSMFLDSPQARQLAIRWKYKHKYSITKQLSKQQINGTINMKSHRTNNFSNCLVAFPLQSAFLSNIFKYFKSF